MTSEGSVTKDTKQLGSTEYGKIILELESAAVRNLAETLDDSFDQAVSKLLSLNETGRVIVSGMGKAGFIAMKISATFASTGLPSFFLHPAEASHGDLGRYSKNDLALVLSNSGETEEILKIIPQIRKTGCFLIAITGNPSSTLAKHSDLVLEIGSLQEAGPLGLAPTTSTTVMLALGDALAMAVLRKQDFSREQFAKYHPGGSLGQALIPVKDIMRVGEELCIVPIDMTAKEVVSKIAATKGRPGAAAIVDQDSILVGIFTDGNLRRSLDQGLEFLTRPVKEVMTKNPKVIAEDKLAADAIRLISQYQIDQVVVVDAKNRPVGMIDIQDLL